MSRAALSKIAPLALLFGAAFVHQAQATTQVVTFNQLASERVTPA
jgi:hypothetical protein